MGSYTRRRFLAGLGSVAATVGCCSGFKTLFATTHKDLFGNYPLALDISLQSSFEGRITGLYSTSYEPEKRQKEYEAVSDFFGQTVHVLSEKEQAPTKKIETQAIRIVYHSWLRDLFLVSEKKLILTPRIFSESLFSMNQNMLHKAQQIQDSAAYIGQREGLSLAVAPCPFEGEQVLKAGEHTLVPEFWRDIRNLGVLRDMRPDLYERIETEEDIDYFYEDVFGPILYVPNYSETFAMFSGHLDMYITPVSQETILVGDTRLADRILSEEGDAVLREYEHFIGEKAESYPGKEGLVNIVLGFESLHKRAIQEVLDRAADFLSQRYKVKRIPLGFLQLGQQDFGFLSYNNALVERATKKGLLPTFGLPQLDREARAVIESEGYTVKGIDGTEGIFRKYGPHCMYLERRKL